MAKANFQTIAAYAAGVIKIDKGQTITFKTALLQGGSFAGTNPRTYITALDKCNYKAQSMYGKKTEELPFEQQFDILSLIARGE